MMKHRTTLKDIKRHYSMRRAIAIHYCEAQNLLKYFNPSCYTAGVYGWNFDGYEIEVNDVPIIITTGYRNTYGMYDFGIVKKYEALAREISNSNKLYSEKKTELNNLIAEMYNELLDEYNRNH